VRRVCGLGVVAGSVPLEFRKVCEHTAARTRNSRSGRPPPLAAARSGSSCTPQACPHGSPAIHPGARRPRQTLTMRRRGAAAPGQRRRRRRPLAAAAGRLETCSPPATAPAARLSVASCLDDELRARWAGYAGEAKRTVLHPSRRAQACLWSLMWCAIGLYTFK
jgi:hypothetical protein